MLFSSEAMQKLFFDLKGLDRLYEGKFPCDFSRIRAIKDFTQVDFIILAMIVFEKKLAALQSEIYQNFFNCFSNDRKEIFLDYLKIEDKIKKTHDEFLNIINKFIKLAKYKKDKKTIETDNKKILKKLNKISEAIDENFFSCGEMNQILKESFQQELLKTEIGALIPVNPNYSLVFIKKEQNMPDFKLLELDQ